MVKVMLDGLIIMGDGHGSHERMVPRGNKPAQSAAAYPAP